MPPKQPALQLKDSRARLLQFSLEVLTCLLHEPRSLGISEVATRIGLPKSTTFRILTALVELKFVHKDHGNRRYSLSPRVFGFIHELTLHYGSVGRFTDVLRKESDRTGFSFYVSTMSGGHTFVVAAAGKYGDSFALGEGSPVYASSAGKVLVSHQNPCDWVSFAPDKDAVKITRFTNVNAERFLQEVKQAKETGVAWNREESSAGFISIAAVINEKLRQPRFAVALLLPKDQLLYNTDRELEQTIQRIARRLDRT